MSNANLARRTSVEVAFDGADITGSIRPYLLSLTYTDNEADETDDLQIKLQDRDELWLGWLGEAIEAASAAQLKMEATIVRENWNGDGKDSVLPCGQFELDSVSADGPPSSVTIKGTSLPYSAQIRQTLKSKGWEAYSLSGIAAEMAGMNGMTCMYESASDPYYARVEQWKTSDIDFLSKLCNDAGISLKATNNILVLFDQAAYESKGAVKTIRKGDGLYTKWKLSSGSADTQYASCRVSYVDPSGSCIEATAKIDDYNEDAKNNQQLEITAKVESIGEAQSLAEKLLRMHNKFAKTATFALPGDPGLAAGVTVTLAGWRAWDGKYIIRQAKHTVSASGGYTTQITLRRALEGY
jgi:phage protein D